MAEDRNLQLIDALVELADTLVENFEVADFTYRLTELCVDILDIDTAGLLVADGDGVLQYLASSDEQTHLLELFQAQQQQGPCHDAFNSGTLVEAADLTDEKERWPAFVPRALELGFTAAHAIPMQMHGQAIGGLNFFAHEARGLDELNIRFGQAMADIATIGIVNADRLRKAEDLSAQLQHALDSRVVIEQAKGVIAERTGRDMNAAFDALRSHARSNNRRIGAVAKDVVDHRLTEL